jgi:hypothetical protein
MTGAELGVEEERLLVSTPRTSRPTAKTRTGCRRSHALSWRTWDRSPVSSRSRSRTARRWTVSGAGGGWHAPRKGRRLTVMLGTGPEAATAEDARHQDFSIVGVTGEVAGA